ncbi:ATP-binding protein [Polymorphum gilvum]|uniref:histidine kinase n=1 Tax=Polymorphum gilvum (strain LMG 25793 / CGMCC 1.9160 / SL003B-26A1) TaxID=991905 RepID=F2J5Z5_POLGS|nr:ATP-binding protein [Polymorphum gilvum]ADZ71249.1 ATPase, histidine kinase-, DNA gyrase B-, and HSP90-like domain protein [Polymorphum gilvum SL003B-26A1]
MSLTASIRTDDKTTINRERALRRREVARTVRTVRDRLGTRDGLRPDFDDELLVLFAKARISAAYPVPMFIVIVAAISFLWTDAALVVLWALFTISIHGLTVATCRRFERTPEEARTAARWRRQFTIGDALYGLCWAALFLLPVSRNATEGLEVFQFATMLIVIAMCTMQSSTLPRALLASTLPITLAIALAFLQQQAPIHYAMAAMAVGAQGFFLVLGNQLLNSAITMLAYRAEKDHLIAELEQANAVSDESRRRAEEANLAKSRFLATMSHELRTPLNAILGFSEIMKDEVLGPMANPTYRSYAADIHGSGQHLLNLINEILDLSRIEAGRYELNEEAVTLIDIVEDCRTMMQIRAKAKDITIRESHEDGLPRLWADERAIRQVILNLLSNAVKFTPSSGEVTIRIGAAPGGGQFVSIRDNGPGIPEDEIPIVLQAFGQGAIAIKSAEAGTGLGLSIVQALVAQHGGTFELKSRLREGTEAIVTLPSNRVLQAMPAFDAADQRSAPRKAGTRRKAS